MKLFHSVRALAIATALAGMFLLTGCILPKVYVDPNFRAPSLNEIATSDPKSVKLVVTGLTNHQPNKGATKVWTKEVTAALEKSKAFTLTDSSDAAVLEIEIDNVADVKDAMAKGFVTGMTFGLSGSVITDRYIMSATYKENGSPVFSGEYKHALHSVMGREDAPIEGVTPTPLRAAPGRVAEDMILNFVRDFQSQAALPAVSTR